MTAEHISVLHDLLRELDDGQGDKTIWTPESLKSMSSWQQQDAQEYFSVIIDKVITERAKIDNAFRRCDGLDISSLSQSESHGRLNLKMRVPDAMPMQGLLAQRVACLECGTTEGISLIPFNCLTVPLERQSWCSIQQCLDSYIDIDQIPNVECACCTLKATATKILALLESLDTEPATEALRKQSSDRLSIIKQVIDNGDYSDQALTETCRIPKRAWKSSTKTRQAVVARCPPALTIHINRSLFDEHTGQQRKNHAKVTYPTQLDMSRWTLGSQDDLQQCETWQTEPLASMADSNSDQSNRSSIYVLKAVISHEGQHEDGHYICYRQHAGGSKWWELSDDSVVEVDREDVLGQTGAFMLFYERLDVGVEVHRRRDYMFDVTARPE